MKICGRNPLNATVAMPPTIGVEGLPLSLMPLSKEYSMLSTSKTSVKIAVPSEFVLKMLPVLIIVLYAAIIIYLKFQNASTEKIGIFQNLLS